MRIAVISDTHDRLPSGVVGRLREADEVWHLGDVCAPTVLDALHDLDLPLHVVAGNCDDHPWPLTLTLTRAGIACHLVHAPPLRAPPGVRCVLHGHTHVPRDETDPAGVRWLNPGCITRPNRGAPASHAWLTLEEGKPIGWQRVLI